MHEEKPSITAWFHPGQIVATPAALAVLAMHEVSVHRLVRRHVTGDWGCVSTEDAKANEEALKEEGRLLSIYLVGNAKVWIITEWDRSATTILLPNEY